MRNIKNANVEQLLLKLLGADKTARLFATLNHPQILNEWEDGTVTRAELAQAMNMALFEDLLARSANGRQYTEEAIAAGGSVYFDHGALRTVRWAQSGALPPGEAAFARILRPLGFSINGRYPLDRLGMTGRAWAHDDAPDEIAQFFVSELHPERFSAEFQQAVTNVIGASRDPLTPQAAGQLWELEREGVLPLEAAHALLPVIVGAFARQHETPREADYEVLLKESAEMAWIATEGNAFNHATDRVADVVQALRRRKGEGSSDEAGSGAFAFGPRVSDRVPCGHRAARIPRGRRQHRHARRAGLVLRVHHAQADLRSGRAPLGNGPAFRRGQRTGHLQDDREPGGLIRKCRAIAWALNTRHEGQGGNVIG